MIAVDSVKRRPRFASLRALALFFALLSAAPAAMAGPPVCVDDHPPAPRNMVAPEGGIGGTGGPALQGGIGGTGKTADAGGIGGTGIVGVITGFGSVCVNGHEVHYDTNTQVRQAGRHAKISDLALGQLIAVHASRHGRSWYARSIAVMYPVVGPIDVIRPGKNGVLKVLNQSIHLTPHTLSLIHI